MPLDDFQQRAPENVPGKYYVSDQCLDCDLCRETTPTVFARHDPGGYSYVRKQPETPEEEALVRECVQACCVSTIHDDGATFDWQAIPANTPFYLTPEGRATRQRLFDFKDGSCCHGQNPKPNEPGNTEPFPAWVKVVRGAGVLLGAFLLCAGLCANLVASDPEQRLRPTQFVAQLSFFAIAALPLVIRWRAVTAKWFQCVLLILLAADLIYFGYSSVESVVWAVYHGERTQVVCFFILDFFTILTIAGQFPAVLYLIKTRGTTVA